MTRNANDRREDAEHESADASLARLTDWADDRLTRIGLRTEFARDCLLAAFALLVSTFLLWALLTLLEQEDGIELARWTVAALATLASAQSIALCIRRSHPFPCLMVVVVLQVAILALIPADTAFQGIAPFIAAYTCGTRFPGRRLLWILTAIVVFQITVGAMIGGHLSEPTVQPTPTSPLTTPSTGADYLMLSVAQLISSVTNYVLAAFIGTYVATRRSYAELLRIHSTETVWAQRARTDAAIRAERSRMARELHDVAAHHLSGMVVQAGAVERLIGREDQAAKEATTWIRTQGKETLDSLRLVVGALREPVVDAASSGSGARSASVDSAPVPGLAVLDRLVQAERDLGATIDVVRNGVPYALPLIADVTFYRVAQEALSNARVHAAQARVHILLRYSESEVSLEVVNRPGRGPGPDADGSPDAPRGLGLIGMRERTQIIGAVLDAGPTASGGWRVWLALPVSREVSAGESHLTEASGSA